MQEVQKCKSDISILERMENGEEKLCFRGRFEAPWTNNDPKPCFEPQKEPQQLS